MNIVTKCFSRDRNLVKISSRETNRLKRLAHRKVRRRYKQKFRNKDYDFFMSKVLTGSEIV